MSLSPHSALPFPSVFPPSPKSDRQIEIPGALLSPYLSTRESSPPTLVLVKGDSEGGRGRDTDREEGVRGNEKRREKDGKTGRETHSWANYTSELCSQGKAQTESTSTAQASAHNAPLTSRNATAGFALTS